MSSCVVGSGSPYGVDNVCGIWGWYITSCVIFGCSIGSFGLCLVHTWDEHGILVGVLGKALCVSVCIVSRDM